MPAVVDKAKARVGRLRARYPIVDHAIRAYRHAGTVLWGQQAAAITYFGFLSIFPLIAVGFAVLSYLTVVSDAFRDDIEGVLSDSFPGLLGDGPDQISIDDIAGAGAGAGVIGVLALLWTGTGAIDAVRDGLRVVFGTTSQAISLPVKKLRDILVLAVLGVLIVASVAVSAVTTSATSLLLDLVDLEESTAAQLLLRFLTVAAAIGLNSLILALFFRMLSGREPSWRQMRGGAVLGAVGLEILKLFATQLIGGTSTNPFFAAFAVAVALLLWINFSARVLMMSAAWVATEPSLLARDTDAEAVHPAALPLVLAPELPAPRSRRGAKLAAVAVLALAALRVGGVRRGAAPRSDAG